jgi:uncharacterized protein (DUF433 family)
MMSIRIENRDPIDFSDIATGAHWSHRIVLNPEILCGKPIIKGSRLAVEFIIDLLAQGWSENDILRNYPGLTHEDITACLGYVSAMLHAEKVFPTPSMAA